MPLDGRLRQQQQPCLTEEQVTEAALNLAISSRDFLGLPSEPHPGGEASSASPTTAWQPPILPSPPTALEFLQRLQAGAAPFLIAGALADRTRLQHWKDNEYLRQTMAGREVKVACTPDGRADDIKTGPLGDKWIFELPEERSMPFGDLLSSFELAASSSPSLSPTSPKEVLYLQSQDSNLIPGSSLSPLLPDLLSPQDGHSSSLSWASQAFASPPEATNLWIGSSASTSSMHRDHYENLFHVVRGRKIFTLFPPTEAYFLCEDEDEPFEVWRHVRGTEGDREREWGWEREGESETPWIPIEPSLPVDSERNRRWGGDRYSKGLKGLKVVVEEGMTLFLPAGWYHHVAQEADEPKGGQAGLCIAINWWYESQAAFSDKWALLEFVKEIGQKVKKGGNEV